MHGHALYILPIFHDMHDNVKVYITRGMRIWCTLAFRCQERLGIYKHTLWGPLRPPPSLLPAAA